MKFEVGQDRVSVHFLIAYVDASTSAKRHKEILGMPFSEGIIKVSREKYTSLFSVEGLNKLFLFIENNIIDNPEKFYNKTKKKFDNDYSKSVKILSKDYKNDWLNVNAALKSIDYLSIYLPALRYFEVVAMRHLKESLQNNNIKISDDDIFTLTSVDNYASLIAKEKLDLLRVASKYYQNKNPKNYTEDLEKHTKKYNNIELHVSTRDLLSFEDFKKRLKDLFTQPRKELIKEFNKIKNSNIELKKKKAILKKKYEFNKYERDILKTIELVSETKVKITDCICLLNLKLINAAKSLSKKWGINEKLFYLMYPDEIKKYSRLEKIGKKAINKIKERENAAIWAKGSRIRLFFGEQAKRFLKRKIIEEKVETDEISGTPIFKGKLKGVVKIVESMKDFSKIKKEDILVSSDTTPDFVPILKKVSGIITNEGGLICHAAIVAREMKIPCVVGTKIATKILKDNDIIELDASSGIIKILNKKK